MIIKLDTILYTKIECDKCNVKKRLYVLKKYPQKKLCSKNSRITQKIKHKIKIFHDIHKKIYFSIPIIIISKNLPELVIWVSPITPN